MRYFYAFLAACMYGAMCGVTVGSAQEMQRAQQAEEVAQDASEYYRARMVQSEANLNSCIKLYADAEKVEDNCQARLRTCMRVEEFGR